MQTLANAHTTSGTMIYRLEEWSVVQSTDPYIAPECRPACLRGRIQNHQDFPSDCFVVTSWIVHVAGRIVTTNSGSQYRLQAIDLKYYEMLQKYFGASWKIDPNHPLKAYEYESAKNGEI